MKQSLLFAFVILSFGALAQATNQKDAQGKKHGVWKKYHEDGKLRYEGTFDHGKEVGEFTFYFPSGDIKAINRFRGKSGVAYSYQFGGDSILAAEGKYINSKRDSVWTFYNIGGDVISREDYKNNERHGKSITYFPSGRKAEITNYANGKKEGEWLQFYETGKPRAKGNYVDNKLEGEVFYYETTGRIRAKGKYVKGLMDGNWYFFDDANKIIKTQVWKKGEMISQDPPEVKDEFFEEEEKK